MPRTLSVVLTFAIVTLGEPALAGTKEECLEAHGRGQDLREKGQLLAAKRAFFACAQSTCPNVVQADCGRMGEEVDRLVPTLGFGARDDAGADLPATTVFVDGTLVANRLDDGRLREVEPGTHTVRFVHDGREKTQTLVVVQGEKGRIVSVVFDDPQKQKPVPPPPRSDAGRPIGPLVFAGIGLGVMGVGGALAAIGVTQVPSQCSLAAKDCAAPPGDAVYGKAQTAVTLTNVGIGVGIAGASMLLVGLIWYLVQPKGRSRELGMLVF